VISRIIVHPVDRFTQHRDDNDVTKVTFIGAGSVEFTRQLVRDLLAYEDLPLTLVLHDIDPARLEVARAVVDRLIATSGRSATVSDTTDRRRALDRADFVINTVQVGGIGATRADLEIPLGYGVRQTIGDTTGVGGVFRALRTFPVLTAIAEDMRVACPEALLLNYTNPMAMNVGWMREIAPDLRAIGLCHSVVWTAHDLSALIGVPFEEVTFRAGGVNHQAWLVEWSRNGIDLYPALRSLIEQDPQLRRRVRVEMFRRVGWYPTETSEHSAEYLSWFMRSDEQIAQFRLDPLTYLAISEQNLATYEGMREAVSQGRDPLAAAPALEDDAGVEYAPQVIHSIVTGTTRNIHVNVPNDALIRALPAHAVVEVPATIDAAGVHPMPMNGLPPMGLALNAASVAVAERTIAAAREGDPRLIREAVLLDPNASSSATPDAIWAMCDDLVAAHSELLPPELRRVSRT
jgi:alpha-galactosidase